MFKIFLLTLVLIISFSYESSEKKLLKKITHLETIIETLKNQLNKCNESQILSKTPYSNCKELKNTYPNAITGSYPITIHPQLPMMNMYCLMDDSIFNGGWTFAKKVLASNRRLYDYKFQFDLMEYDEVLIEGRDTFIDYANNHHSHKYSAISPVILVGINDKFYQINDRSCVGKKYPTLNERFELYQLSSGRCLCGDPQINDCFNYLKIKLLPGEKFTGITDNESHRKESYGDNTLNYHFNIYVR